MNTSLKWLLSFMWLGIGMIVASNPTLPHEVASFIGWVLFIVMAVAVLTVGSRAGGRDRDI